MAEECGSVACSQKLKHISPHDARFSRPAADLELRLFIIQGGESAGRTVGETERESPAYLFVRKPELVLQDGLVVNQ